MKILMYLLKKIGIKKAHISVKTENVIDSYAAEAWLFLGSPLNRKIFADASLIIIHDSVNAQRHAEATAKNTISRSTVSIKHAGGLTFSDVEHETIYQEDVSERMLRISKYIVINSLQRASKQAHQEQQSHKD